MIVKFMILLPIICDAKIKLNITVSSNKHDVLLQFSGADNKLVTVHENELFNMSFANVNRGMRVELGRVPNRVFFKDPTQYGNLFNKFKWPEVRRSLRVEKIEVIEVITKEVVLKLHEHINNTTANIKTDRSLSVDVENSGYSSWSSHGLPEDEIFYDVVINCGNTTFQYVNKWRDRSLKAGIVRFGKSEKRKFNLAPEQSVVKNLTALKTVFVVQIDYKAQLIGNLIADYENLYGKYHFYAPLVDNIMKAGNITNEIRTREKMEIRCYTDPKLVIYDMKTGAPVKNKRLNWKLKHGKFW